MGNCHLLIETAGPARTQEIAARLGMLLRGGDVIALSGDLGSGKTTFTQGLARGLGVTSPVTSPTFVLINRYPARDGLSLHHADCYRLSHAPAEMWDAGLSELFAGDGVVVVEWADRIPNLLPAAYLEIVFDYLGDDRRRLCLVGHGAPYVKLIDALTADIAPGAQAGEVTAR